MKNARVDKIKSYTATLQENIYRKANEGRNELVKVLSGNVQFYKKLLDAISVISPVPIEFLGSGMRQYGEYDSRNKIIYIRDGMSKVQTIKVCIHEVAHASYHAEGAENEEDKAQKEVEAETIAYLVCRYYGIDTLDYSVGYILYWQVKGGIELKNIDLDVQGKAKELIQKIEEGICRLDEEEFEKETELMYMITEDSEYLY